MVDAVISKTVIFVIINIVIINTFFCYNKFENDFGFKTLVQMHNVRLEVGRSRFVKISRYSIQNPRISRYSRYTRSVNEIVIASLDHASGVSI